MTVTPIFFIVLFIIYPPIVLAMYLKSIVGSGQQPIHIQHPDTRKTVQMVTTLEKHTIGQEEVGLKISAPEVLDG